MFHEVTEILNIMEAAPPQVRPVLAASASTRTFNLNWYSGSSAVADFFEAQSSSADSEFENRVLAMTHHVAVTMDSGSRLGRSSHPGLRPRQA